MKNLIIIALMLTCSAIDAQTYPDTSSVVITPTQVVEYAFPTRKVLSRREYNDTVIINTPPNTIQYFHFMDKFAKKGIMVRDITITYYDHREHEHLTLLSNNNMYGRMLGPITIFIGKARKLEE